MTNRIAVCFPYSFVIRHSCFVIESIHIPLIPLLILQLLNVFVGLLNAFAALLLNDLAQRRIDVLCHPARIAAHKKVCGDARRMAKDVDATLRKIVQEQGGKSVEQANEYVEKLKNEKRYKRDVY